MMQKKKQSKRKAKNAFIQVGVDKLGPRPLKYSDTPRSLSGWVSDLQFRPFNFDLVLLKVLDRDKPISGWWDGLGWQGRLWKPNYKVTAWKRSEEYA